MNRLLSITAVTSLLIASPVAAETWQAFSRNAQTVYLADVDSITVEGDITSIRVGRVPRKGPAGDYAHQIEIYAFRCAANEWRSISVTDIGSSGLEDGNYPEEMSWEPVNARGIAAYIKDVACDGARANPPFWTSLRAFIDAGRGEG